MTTTEETSEYVDRESLYLSWRHDREQASPRPLRSWIDSYPDFADDLVTWASDLPLYESSEYKATFDDEQALAPVGRSVVAEVRARYGLMPPAVTSLLDAARRRNLRIGDLADRLGVGVPIVSKLEQRLIQYATIPRSLMDRMAEVLDIGVETVASYLRQPPTLAAGADYQYVARERPQVRPQETFAAAVRACPGMSDADRRAWLEAAEA